MALPIILITTFCASFITLFSGFGLGSVLMPVMAIFFPVSVAVALTAVVHLLNNLFKLATMWRHIHWEVGLRFGIPALLAAIPGALILMFISGIQEPIITTIADKNVAILPVNIVIGLLLIGFAIVEWSNMAKKVTIPLLMLPLGGILSGFFGGLSGHQGAFRSMFLLHSQLNSMQFVATNAFIASLVDVSRIIIYGLSFSLVTQHVSIGVMGLTSAVSFLAVFIGKRYIKKVTIDWIQRLVAFILMGLGMTMLAKGVS